MKNIYSKENLEELVFDLIKYLYRTRDYYDERLSENILFYANNKMYCVDEEKCNFKLGKIPVYIEDGVNVSEYFEFCNKDTMALSMDARLNEYLYYYDVPGCKEVSKKVSDIFEKHGFYYEFGSNWYLYAMEIPKNN